MHQQWLQVLGIVFDGVGFGLIALEWYRGYVEMRTKVKLVARELERAEKFRLRNELKQAIGSVGVGEVEALYNDDKALADMADHVFEMPIPLPHSIPATSRIQNPLIVRVVDPKYAISSFQIPGWLGFCAPLLVSTTATTHI
jgi:hypothetical protein